MLMPIFFSLSRLRCCFSFFADACCHCRRTLLLAPLFAFAASLRRHARAFRF